MHQRGTTVIVDILPEKTEALRKFLRGIGEDIKGNPHIRFEKIQTVHFLRWVILDQTEVRGEMTGPQLMFSSNHDGKFSDHLDEILQVAGPAMLTIYSHCINAPEDISGLKKFLMARRFPIATLHIGARGCESKEIHREHALRYEIENFLQDSNPSQNWSEKQPQEIRKAIQEHIGSHPDFQWAMNPPAPNHRTKWNWALLISTLVAMPAGLGLLAWLFPKAFAVVMIILVLFLAVWFVLLRRMEEKDAREFQPVYKDPEQNALLAARENHTIQNQLTHVVEIKPGLVRQFTIRAAFFIVRQAVRTLWAYGNLGGIQSVHYGRWMLINGGKRLLFLTNYDGSWESYLSEFCNRAPRGLSLVWSNTVGYPPTKWLISGGARHPDEFKAWSRINQVETQVWYSSYLHTSLLNVLNNRRIRNGLRGKMNDQQVKEWLRLL